MNKIALSLLLAVLSASAFAATKEDINKEIDSCNQLTVQYLQTSQDFKDGKIKTVAGDISQGEYDGSAVDQLYTVFDLPEQKRQAKEVAASAFDDRDPVSIIKSKHACTVQVKLGTYSSVKPIVEQK
ncbi:conserved exported hypothetical protein [Burkholderia cenocepacia]|uniref:hypothetical protein n=1 Tax=Burkholderia cenocepacia TaxID=95486 RepID=UPI00192C2F38|nr:hypothetical protein [Burkholderia cenocepacia]CAD9228064.1 conserved exported hypothetical protein [Burkholderia cenocepacia]